MHRDFCLSGRRDSNSRPSLFMQRRVGAARLELAAFWSQTRRATNCATPRPSFALRAGFCRSVRNGHRQTRLTARGLKPFSPRVSFGPKPDALPPPKAGPPLAETALRPVYFFMQRFKYKPREKPPNRDSGFIYLHRFVPRVRIELTTLASSKIWTISSPSEGLRRGWALVQDYCWDSPASLYTFQETSVLRRYPSWLGSGLSKRMFPEFTQFLKIHY